MERFFIAMLYFDNYDAFKRNDSGFLVPLDALKKFISVTYVMIYKFGIWVSLCCFILAAVLVGVYGGGNMQEYAKAKSKMIGVILSVGVLCAIPWIIKIVQRVFGGMEM